MQIVPERMPYEFYCHIFKICFLKQITVIPMVPSNPLVIEMANGNLFHETCHDIALCQLY